MHQEQPQPEQTSTKAAPRRRFRFTLWKMIIGFMIIGLVLTYLRYTHWGFVISENIASAGRSVGLVEPKAANKIHVSAARPLQNDSWEWNIELPPGTIYMLCCHTEDIPKTGDPDEIPRHRGEVFTHEKYLVEISVDEHNGFVGLRQHVYTTYGALPRYVSGGWMSNRRVEWARGVVEQLGIQQQDGEVTFDPGEKIVLLHQWPAASDPQMDAGSVHREGILIWLEPAPPTGPWVKTPVP